MFKASTTVVVGLLSVGLIVFSDVRVSQGHENPAPENATTRPAGTFTAGPQKDRPWSLPLSAHVTLGMMWIPAGTFTMGSPESEPMSNADERPPMQVTLTQGFWLGKTMFTIGQWKSVTGLDVRGQLSKVLHDDTLYDLGGRKQTVRNFMRFNRDADLGQYLAREDDDLPMYFVSWNDAMEICRKLTAQERAAGRLPEGYEYTLPTEAQFEYACRAGTKEATYAGPLDGKLHSSPVLDRIAWYDGNSAEGYIGKGFHVDGRIGGPHAVAQKQPNAWGLYDMVGNIWQWCRDWYGPFPGGKVTNPTGPTTGTDRVNRGGSFGSGPGNERSASRAKNPQAEASAYRGFRVALCPVQSSAMLLRK